MQNNNMLRAIVIGSAVLLASGSAFAKGATKQNHHCKLADGSMDMAKTKKQCLAAKGAWAKDADAAMPAAPATPATPAAAAAPATPATPATPAMPKAK